MPDYLQRSRSADPDRAALEQIAHLTRKICATWGSPELDVFLSRLIMDARDGERKGFPIAVATELLFLAQLNKMVRAIDLGKKLSMDPRAAFRIVDDEDQARLTIDPLDDPTVSHDTIVARPSRAASGARAEARTPARDVKAQARGLGELLGMVFGNKWLIRIIVLLIGFKLAWPLLKPLI